MAVGMRGGPGSSDPGQFTATNLTLLAVILRAYDIPRFRLAGPSWIYTERFNIVAKVPAGATRDQFLAMLQNLLAERFKLTVHSETRQEPVFALMIDKGGPKMKESPKSAPAEGEAAPFVPMMDKDGFPKIPEQQEGLWINFNGSRFLIQAHKRTTTALAELLSDQLDRPVIDETGLNASYDFALEFSSMPTGAAPPEDGPESESALSIFSAVKQLGLRLESRKGPVAMIVVDSGQKTPTEN
jgi:uncharacterized protein (TIGR03435 family)